MNIISPVTGKNNIRVVRKLNSEKIKKQYKEEFNIDISFEGIDEIFIYECKDSLYRFYYPSKLVGDGPFYESLQRNTPSSYYSWRWEHEKALDEINKDDFVLDIGCGSGYFLSKALDRTNNIQGLEYNDLAIQHCKEKNIPVVKSDIQDFSKNKEGVYDIVCAFQVLEHIYDVKSFIDSCIRVLKPDGKLIIGVPNNNPYLHKHDLYHTLNLPPHHIGLWNKKSLKRLPLFFPMKNYKLQIEPNFNYDYWIEIQTNHYLGDKKIGRLAKRVANRLFKRFNKYIDGRNLLAIYKK